MPAAKRKLKVQRYKTRKAKEVAAESSKRFINPRDVKGARGHLMRDSTLGEEFRQRGKSGGIVDKREGGDNADEDAMLGRMKRVRQQKADLFKLSDGNDSLTHYGTSLGGPEVPRFEQEEEDDEEPAAKRRKTRNEILDEIIDKSKASREEKRVAAEERDTELNQLDEEFGTVATLLKMQKNEKKPIPGVSVGPSPFNDKEKKSRVLVLGSDGSVKSSTKTEKDSKSNNDNNKDEDIRKKMDVIMKKVKKENQQQQQQNTQKTENELEEEVDEYDKLMMDLESSGIARVGHRTKSAAELASEAEAELLALKRQKQRHMTGEADDASESEENDAADLQAIRASSAKGTQEAQTRKQASGLFDAYLTQLETECKNSTINFENIDTILHQLRNLTTVSNIPSCMTAKTILELLHTLLQTELHQKKQKQTSKSSSSTPFSILIPSILSKLYPPSDYRHPIITPLALHLTAALSQLQISSLRDIAVGIFHSATLLDMSTDTHRYCGELVTFLTNIVSLQCQQSTNDNVSYSDIQAEKRGNTILSTAVPQLTTDDAVSLLAPSGKSKKLSDEPLRFNDWFCTPDQTVKDTMQARHQLLCATYRLLQRMVNLYASAEGTEALEGSMLPLIQTLESVSQHKSSMISVSPTLKALHDDLVKTLKESVAKTTSARVPLRLQSHRPIPLPLYDCKITEYREGEEAERRALKKQFREEEKRARRDLQQDARFLNAAKDAEREEEDERREEVLKKMTADLQSQRSMIKENDVARAKLKDMQKKAAKK